MSLNSSMSLLFCNGTITNLNPFLIEDSNFSARPPIGKTHFDKHNSPVIAKSGIIGVFNAKDRYEVVIAIPAEGPSFDAAP